MAYGIIGFGQPGDTSTPSGNIWGDCSSQELADEGTGYISYTHFIDTGVLPGITNDSEDSGTFTYSASFDHVMNVLTGATDNDGMSVFTRPLGPLASGSGKKFWAEASIALADITANCGIFFGLSVLAGLSHDVIADNPDSATAVIANSLVGFLYHNGQNGKFDIVQRNAAAAAVNPILDVTNAASITANGGTIGNVVNDTLVKLGFRFDGQQYLYVYVNGVQAGKLTVDATYDQTHDYGVILAIKTGTGAGKTVRCDFVKAAVKLA